MVALIDDIWADEGNMAPSAPHLEVNRFLKAAMQAPKRAIRELRRTEIELFGEKLIWLHEDGAQFPKDFLDALQRLVELVSATENWNSYGGKAISLGSIRPVLSLLTVGHSRCAIPNLIPLSDGGIGLRWQSGDRELSIDVLNDRLEGCLCTTDDEFELSEPASVDDATRLLEAFCKAG
jgi:hypothetical protein